MSSDAKKLKQSKPDLKARESHETVTPDSHNKWAEFIERVRKELGWTLDQTCDLTDMKMSWLKKARRGQDIDGGFREKFENAINKRWGEKFPDKPPLPWPAWVDGAPWSQTETHQAQIDDDAFSLVHRHLNRPNKEVDVQILVEALARSSTETKRRVFYLAKILRDATWESQLTKVEMEKTIPVFRALIAIDGHNEFHRNHGQLGYALKDQRVPDYAAAEEELTKAIEIRNRHGGAGSWLWYEFNRAVCIILQDAFFHKSQPAYPLTRKRVLADLRAAFNGETKRVILEYQPVIQWLKTNEVGPEHLSSDRIYKTG